MNGPFCSSHDLGINLFVLTITQLFLCHTLDLVILRYALTEVQSSFKVLCLDFGIRQSDTVEVFKLKVDLSCLGRPTINKLITLGGQEPLPFTPSLRPPFEKTQYLCTILSLTSKIPTKRRQLQLPLYCGTFSAAPILSLQCGQRLKKTSLKLSPGAVQVH